MAGDGLTLADLFHLPFAAMLVDHGAGDIIEKRQNVKRQVLLSYVVGTRKLIAP